MTAIAQRASGRRRRSGRPGIWARLSRNHLAVVGLGIVAGMCVLALMTPLLPLADPNATDLAARLKRPFTDGHLLGTDQLGRDMLSRILWGARVSIAVGAVATIVAATIGSLIGIVAGFYGRWLDNTLMRGVDMLMAFPYMLLALAIVAALGPGLLNALFAIAIVNIPFFARSVRGVTISLVRLEYVDAARMSGLGNGRILFSEILPNVVPVIVVTMSTTLGWMILETAGLSFLGLGAQPPQADLGSMLGDGRKLAITAPHVATIPGLVILVLVIGINLLGDGIRDVLDPRLKSGALSRPRAMTEVAPAAMSQPERSAHSNAALALDRLSTEFRIGHDVYHATRDISFQVAPGECVGIVGESGSGKSVTAMSVLGLVPTPPGLIAGGQVVYQEENLLAAPLPRLQQVRGGQIAYVFQDPLTTLNPLYTVGDQIAETVERHQGLSRRDAWQRAVELMESVHIPDAAGRARAYPHELSGGMRQRIVIAMALANDPDVIIADEPTTALDVTIQAQVLKLLDELRRKHNAALVFITHDFGVVSEICDHVQVMYAGEVVESGRVQDVFERPLHPYTRRLMSCIPQLGRGRNPIAAIPGLPPAVNDLPPGCPFAPRCDVATAACTPRPISLAPHGEGREVRCIRPGESPA
ncbi:dipeptide/oligopeptide/nickel ABC transporter permease/ATP-binding protein [Ferruginivarius sediminum]|uniref:ABC transporter permease subunit n=1 Tax=Ferruginivarius sediminum TaxID=2661937 RepID=A0A369T714_9PROT|nr:dipeptide/oligopeptide/nickel ABC transporter permease/ATP-binding protein [Ferruginivarius sediminum]RDD60662.1 ABC transporter permease subunit [Ferruginivarius sediminum]